MPDYFSTALSDFTKNFAWGGVISHLLDRGYTIDQMISEERVPLTHRQIEDMAVKINRQRRAEGKPEFEIR